MDSTKCTETQILNVATNADDSHNLFGYSVNIDISYAIIGAWGRATNLETNGTKAGSAYIFERDVDGSWNQLTMVTANNASKNDEFGKSVSISGNYSICGAWGEDTTAGTSGAAYIIEPGVV